VACRLQLDSYTLSDKLGLEWLGPPDSGWNPAIFLILFGASVANRDIHADDPTGCQLGWIASASIFSILTIFYARCPFCLNAPSLSWLGTDTELCQIVYSVAWFELLVWLSKCDHLFDGFPWLRHVWNLCRNPTIEHVWSWKPTSLNTNSWLRHCLSMRRWMLRTSVQLLTVNRSVATDNRQTIDLLWHLIHLHLELRYRLEFLSNSFVAV